MRFHAAFCSIHVALILVHCPDFSYCVDIKAIQQILIMGQTYSWIQRKMAGADEEAMPTTLEEFGYHFNQEGQLRTMDTNEPFTFSVREDDGHYNQRRYNAIGEIITEMVYSMLEKDFKLQRTYLPINAAEDEPRSFVFHSGDLYTNSDKLFILIHGNGVVRAGQWARRLIMNDCLDHGTQFPYIKWAKENGYAILVANPNLNTVENNINGNKKKKEPIPIKGNGSPEEHINTVWRDFVQRSPARRVAIVAHSYGGVCTLELAKKYLREFEERVFAVAYTDSVHSLKRQAVNEDVIKYYKKAVVNWASAYDALDIPLNTIEDDIHTVSAGTDKHENTNYTSMQSIFKYFIEKLKEADDPNREPYIVGGYLRAPSPMKLKSELRREAEAAAAAKNTASTENTSIQAEDGEATSGAENGGVNTSADGDKDKLIKEDGDIEDPRLKSEL